MGRLLELILLRVRPIRVTAEAELIPARAPTFLRLAEKQGGAVRSESRRTLEPLSLQIRGTQTKESLRRVCRSSITDGDDDAGGSGLLLRPHFSKLCLLWPRRTAGAGSVFQLPKPFRTSQQNKETGKYEPPRRLPNNAATATLPVLLSQRTAVMKADRDDE